MKFSGIFQTLAVCSTLGSATIFFERLPSKLNIGDEVQLNWTADHDYVSTAAQQGSTTENIGDANSHICRH